MLSRREFLSTLLAGGSATALGLGGCSRSVGVPLLSVARSRNHDYAIRIFSPDKVQQTLLPIPARAHDLSLHPAGHTVVCFDRRPGTRMYVVNLIQERLTLTQQAAAGRHFFGHGVFSHDGEWLYTTENDYQTGAGVIGVYRTRDWARMDELPSYGIGCHELCLHPNGRTLVVANGGILTHPNQPREKLNLDSMAPRLSYIDRLSGQLLEERSFGHHQLSIRHLDLTDDGVAVIGMQFQGQLFQQGVDEVPALVAVHRRGQPVLAMNASESQWLALSQYIASVVCMPDNRTVVTTSPRGNCVAFWDIEQSTQLACFAVRDVAGAAVTGPNQVVVSNGLGELVFYTRKQNAVVEQRRLHYADTAWDNHMLSSF